MQVFQHVFLKRFTGYLVFGSFVPASGFLILHSYFLFLISSFPVNLLAICPSKLTTYRLQLTAYSL